MLISVHLMLKTKANQKLIEIKDENNLFMLKIFRIIFFVYICQSKKYIIFDL